MKCDALMIAYKRPAYFAQAFQALQESDCETIVVVHNGKEGVRNVYIAIGRRIIMSIPNPQISIASAMNIFLKEFTKTDCCIKVDDDTLIPPDFCARMLPHMEYADIVQAKHPIIKETNPDGWEGFTKNMKRENGLLYNHFVGGSGIMFKRDKVKEIPETEWVIGGWRQFQREHPELKKAFCEDVEIELLDAHGYEDYPDYYKSTGRLK